MRNIQSISLILVLATVLVGCASTSWNHPTLSESDFYRDSEDCNQYAQATNPVRTTPYNPYLDSIQQANQSAANAGAQLGRAFGVQSSIENCLLGKGYRKVRK
jgi:hypothetical protein